jgi:quercetin dioxygenase-like cupin family protein
MKRCLVTGLRFVMVEGRYAGDCGIPSVGLWIPESVFGETRQQPVRLTGGIGCPGYGRPMDAFAIDRSDGREDGEDWTENYEELPGGANISIILESTTKAGVGPRLHKHPYAETFIIRRGWATFTVGSEKVRGHAGQVLVVPADTPHKFSTGPDGYEGVHIHANVRFITEWLE